MAARLRNIALRLLGHHRVPALLVERVAREAEVATLEAALAAAEHRVPLADRALFFHESPAEAEVARCEERLRVAREALAASVEASDRATRSVWAACPPVEIAHRAESIIAIALTNPLVGRLPRDDEAVLDDLDALVDRVAEVWAPGVDLSAVAERLLDDTFRAGRAGSSLGPPLADVALGWAPIRRDELETRAAQALEAGGFRELRAAVMREAGEYEAMAARVEEARKAARKARRTEREEHQHRELEANLRKEEHEAILAAEAELHAVQHALGVYPPFAIVIAARAAAGAIRSGTARSRYEHRSDGRVTYWPAGYLRTLLLAALVDLRRAVDGTFPGLSGLVSGRAVGAPRASAPISETEQALFDELERWQLRPLLARGLEHAAMCGLLSVARSESGWFGRLVQGLTPWAGGPVAELSRRMAWHHRIVHDLGDHALAMVHRIASRDPIVKLRWLLAEAQGAVGAVHYGRTSAILVEYELTHLPSALAAIDALGSHLGATFGLRGGHPELVADLLAELQRPTGAGPYRSRDAEGHASVVAAIAREARGTELCELLTFAEHRAHELEMSRPPRPPAFAGQSVWVPMSVAVRDVQREVLDHREVWAAVDRASAIIDAALLSHPPAALYYALLRVRGQVAGIRIDYMGGGFQGTREPRIIGKDTALELLRRWALQVDHVFGIQPTLSWLLERFVRRELE